MKTRILPLVLTLFLITGPWLSAQNERPPRGNNNPFLIRMDDEMIPLEARDVFQELFGMNESEEFRQIKSDKDPLGFVHDVYQQYYKGVKVEGACYKVHSRDGEVELLSGHYYDIFQEVETTPSLREFAALAAALNHVKAKQYIWQGSNKRPRAELVILADPKGVTPPKLAYKFDIYATDPLYRANVFIDAHSGEFITEHPIIHHTDVDASGNSLYNGQVNFTADFTGSAYRLRQNAFGGGIETYDMGNGTSYSRATDITSSSSNFTNDDAAVQAHWGAEQTYQYFLQRHGRNSFNGAGATIRSYVHYSTNYVNAFWDGARMTYGDGDGQNYGPLVSLDIVGHEIAHGVTQYAADLIYQNESGALNESFSDIFGEAIENFASGSNDWELGSEIGIMGSGAFRSLRNPKAFRDPDTYQGQYWYTGAGDNGGVHINSGVQNKWFYILTEGENGTNDLGNSYNVPGLGMEKAAAIAYRNLTVYLSPSSNYFDARVGAIQSAVDLFGEGSPEVIATTNAWYAVGVGGEYGTTDYCGSAGQNAQFEWIANVTIGDFSNDSGSAGYSDFTGQKVNIFPGNNYSVSLSPQFSGQTYNEYWKIWIDFNIDGDFDDADELVFDSGSLSSSTVNGSISIPSYAYGETRMRVSMKWDAEQTSPCEVFNYGEVEDYTVSFSTSNDTQPPTTPPNLSASNITETSVRINWGASSDNVGVNLYKIYVNGGLYGSTNTRSFTVTALDPGTTYSLAVTAEDLARNESAPNTISVTTLGGGDSQAPTPPGSLSAINTSETSTRLIWSAASDNVGVVAYRVYIDGIFYASTINRNMNINGLSPGTTYVMGVTALDAAGNESAPRTVAVTTDQETDTQPPSIPGNLSVTNRTTSSISLSWSSSSDNVGVTQYLVYRNNTFLGATANTNFTAGDLSPGSTYTFFVAARDAAGNQSSFNSISATTLEDTDTAPPTPPSNLYAANTTASSTQLFWSAASDNVGVVNYRIYQLVSNSRVLIGTTANLNFFADGLSPATQYVFFVTARDAAGNESASAAVVIQTAAAESEDTEAPSSPGNLTATNTTTTSTRLSWTAASDNVGVDAYRIYQFIEQDMTLIGTTSELHFTVNGLSASTTYSFRVRAVDAAGNESGSAAISVTTLDDEGEYEPGLIAAHYFENGWDGWIDGGVDCYRYMGVFSWEGNYSIRIRDNSGEASTMTSPAYDLRAYSQLELEFTFYARSMENGERFVVQYYDGDNWNTLADYASGSDFVNGNFYGVTVPISRSDYNFAQDSRLRIQCDASANSDQIYVDAVTLTSVSGTELQTLADQAPAKIRKLETISMAQQPGTVIAPGMDEEENAPYFEGISLSPNPVRHQLNVNLPGNARSMRITGANGALIREFTQLDELGSIDVSDLKAGLYFLTVQTTEEVTTKRFVKR